MNAPGLFTLARLVLLFFAFEATNVRAAAPTFHELTRTSVVTARGRLDEISVVTYDDLVRIFRFLAEQPDIPFRYLENGCQARAHAMARLMDRENLIVQKVFAQGDLRVQSPYAEWGEARWSYHTAIVLRAVRDTGEEDAFVIDPAIFDHPVSVPEWTAIQTAHDPAQTVDVFFTRRFNYGAADRKKFFDDYQATHLMDTYRMLEAGMRIQESRSVR